MSNRELQEIRAETELKNMVKQDFTENMSFRERRKRKRERVTC